MAGGIDWFRWHHGSVTDPKFQLVARRSGASVAEVIAVWACLLEQASQAEQRGRPGEPDFESLDCALGLQDGRAQAIYLHMMGRGLLSEDGAVSAWDRRQPKHEDDTAAERKRRQREREHELRMTELASQAVTHCHDDVTHCHAPSRPVTIEESREEKKEEPPQPPRKRAGSAAAPPGFEVFWTAYPKRRNRGDAEKAWAKLKPSADLQATILRAVEVAKARDDWRKDGGQFVPYPASWLNAKGWEDDVAGEASHRPVDDPQAWRRDPFFAGVE